MTGDRRAYRARWLFPADVPPVENGTLIVENEIISDITTARVPDAIDLGSVAIIPGLVNAHTHLEFSHLDVPLTPKVPFTSWIDRVVVTRRDPSTTFAERIRQGVRESIGSGVAAVGEIATSPASEDVLRDAQIDTILFREVIGLHDDHQTILDNLRKDFASPTGSRIIKGVSPHAPYSVHPELVEKLIELAREVECPVAMHLAETKSELEFLASRTGEFRDMLERYQIWPGDVWKRSFAIRDYLETLSRSPRALVVHGNYLSADDIDVLSENPQLTVVYCPRTHAFFRHDPHPWQKLRSRGVNVVLGTDGRCSNPDLSIWNEVLFLGKLSPAVSPQELLAMVTHCAADAIGLDADNFRLAVGRPLRASVIDRIPIDETDPFAAVTHQNTVASWLP